MDNKITKGRLSNFLSYEWLFIILVLILSFIGFEVLYSFAEVKLNCGQSFRYFYDTSVMSTNIVELRETFDYRGENSTFSYDVLALNHEVLFAENYVLPTRLLAKDGDAIITDCIPTEKDGELTRAESIIYAQNVYDLDELYSDAHTYLSAFLKDGETDCLVYDNLDEAKIEKRFTERLGRDNRTRAGLISAEDEKGRIKQLCKEVSDFKFLLENHGEIFYTSKVNHSWDEPDESVKKYGILPEKLTGGQHASSTFFRILDADVEKQTVKNTVVMVFDLSTFQPDMQYETISFLNSIVRTCSNLLG